MMFCYTYTLAPYSSIIRVLPTLQQIGKDAGINGQTYYREEKVERQRRGEKERKTETEERERQTESDKEREALYTQL